MKSSDEHATGTRVGRPIHLHTPDDLTRLFSLRCTGTVSPFAHIVSGRLPWTHRAMYCGLVPKLSAYKKLRCNTLLLCDQRHCASHQEARCCFCLSTGQFALCMPATRRRTCSNSSRRWTADFHQCHTVFRHARTPPIIHSIREQHAALFASKCGVATMVRSPCFNGHF